MSYKAQLIQCEHGPGFQDYAYEDGSRVPHGEDIGVEIQDELILLEGIFYAQTSWNDLEEQAALYEEEEEDSNCEACPLQEGCDRGADVEENDFEL